MHVFLDRFVFENQIDFIQDEVMQGENVCVPLLFINIVPKLNFFIL